MTETSQPMTRNLSVPRIGSHRVLPVSQEGAVADSLQAFMTSEHNSANSSKASVPVKRQNKKTLMFIKPQSNESELAADGANSFTKEHSQMLAAIGYKQQPRSSSHAARKVGFDIKEGLR